MARRRYSLIGSTPDLGGYLTASSSPTLTGTWDFSGATVTLPQDYAELTTTTQSDTYLYLNRTGTAGQPPLHVAQVSTGEIAKFYTTSTLGSTTPIDSFTINNDGGFTTSGIGNFDPGATDWVIKFQRATAQKGGFYVDAGNTYWLNSNGNGVVYNPDGTQDLYVAGRLSADNVWVRQLDYTQTGFEWFNHTSQSVTVGTWYTIASDPSTLNITQDPVGKSGASRASARIKIWDVDSGQHGYIEFEVSCNYHRRPRITILNSSSYGGDVNVIQGIRVVRYSTYNGVAIQVKAGHTGNLRCALHTQHSGGFSLRDFVAQTPHASWKIDNLDFSSWGSVIPAFGSFSGPTDGQTGTNNMLGIAHVRLGNGVGSAADSRFYPAGPSGGYFTANDQTYGTLRLMGTQGGYTGICFDAGTGHRQSIMNSGTNIGLYNDTDNQWLLYGQANSIVALYYNGTDVARTHTNGLLRTSQGTFYHNASSSYTSGKVTFSTSAASGGTSGDIWFQYV